MSFGWTAATWAAIGAVTAAAGVGASAYAANQGRAQQNQAMRQAAGAAAKNNQMADEATNRANAKSPDVAALMASNLAAGQQGAAGTMLTGPGGVDPNSLTLGKNTLLGGG
jgi:hypothetical protein